MNQLIQLLDTVSVRMGAHAVSIMLHGIFYFGSVGILVLRNWYLNTRSLERNELLYVLVVELNSVRV